MPGLFLQFLVVPFLLPLLLFTTDWSGLKDILTGISLADISGMFAAIKDTLIPEMLAGFSKMFDALPGWFASLF